MQKMIAAHSVADLKKDKCEWRKIGWGGEGEEEGGGEGGEEGGGEGMGEGDIVVYISNWFPHLLIYLPLPSFLKDNLQTVLI